MYLGSGQIGGEWEIGESEFRLREMRGVAAQKRGVLEAGFCCSVGCIKTELLPPQV